MSTKTDNDADSNSRSADDIQNQLNNSSMDKDEKTSIHPNEISNMAANDVIPENDELISAAFLARQLNDDEDVFKLSLQDGYSEETERIVGKLLSHSQPSSEESSDNENSPNMDLLSDTSEPYNRLEAWLNTVKTEEEQAEGEQGQDPMLTSKLWRVDSDAEQELEIMENYLNPFRVDLADEVPKEQQEDINNSEEPSAERKINFFIKLVESCDAVPKFALSDEVYNVDRPHGAFALGDKLPKMEISTKFKERDTLKIYVTHVYSPFQFWFHVDNDDRYFETFGVQLNQFYDSICYKNWQLPKFFMKPGYICVVNNQFAWRRARIVREPESNEQHVKVFLLDYGMRVVVEEKDMCFLHTRFAEQPSFLLRGTLTDVYPLDLHWPMEATLKFKELVQGQQLQAVIKDIDHEEHILFINISKDDKTISDLLIAAKQAGRSKNYTAEIRAANCGRRLRYLRERLPTFDMLETEVFQATEEFEEQFDHIIYTPTFYQKFQMPQALNPFLLDLQQALGDWLVRFKAEQLAWCKRTEETNENLIEGQQKRLEQLKDQQLNDLNELED